MVDYDAKNASNPPYEKLFKKLRGWYTIQNVLSEEFYNQKRGVAMLERKFTFFNGNDKTAQTMLEQHKDQRLVGVLHCETRQVFLAPLLPENILAVYSSEKLDRILHAYTVKEKNSIYGFNEYSILAPGEKLSPLEPQKKLATNQLMLGEYLPLAKTYMDKNDEYQYHLAPSLLLDKFTKPKPTRIFDRDHRNKQWGVFEAFYSETEKQWKIHFNKEKESNPCCCFAVFTDLDVLSLNKMMENEFSLLTPQVANKEEKAEAQQASVAAAVSNQVPNNKGEPVGPSGSVVVTSPRMGRSSSLTGISN